MEEPRQACEAACWEGQLQQLQLLVEKLLLAEKLPDRRLLDAPGKLPGGKLPRGQWVLLLQQLLLLLHPWRLPLSHS